MATNKEIRAKGVTVEQLSNEFTKLVRGIYTKAQITEINAINAEPGNENTCATHDFYDANEIMSEAWVNLIGSEINFHRSYQAELWNSAWCLSKKNKFAKK